MTQDPTHRPTEGCGGACTCAETASRPAEAHVNGVSLLTPDEALDAVALRQRACTELLRQAAIREGLLASDDPKPVGGAISEAASAAVEQLLDRVLQVPEPGDEACRRHHEANAARFAVGERVRARHVLFAVTPGLDVNGLRQRAEACLLDVRNATPQERAAGDRFAAAAAANSNCPSGREGGQLGWLSAPDCAPEFARELFGHPEVGVLPRLVHSRFGLHVVEVLEREPGAVPPYHAVRERVALVLRQQSFATALSQYLRLLAGNADLQGVDLEGAETPLVQ